MSGNLIKVKIKTKRYKKLVRINTYIYKKSSKIEKNKSIRHMNTRHCKGKVSLICRKLFDSENSMLIHKQQEHPPVKCKLKA